MGDLQQTACLVFNLIMLDSYIYAFLFTCSTLGRVSDYDGTYTNLRLEGWCLMLCLRLGSPWFSWRYPLAVAISVWGNCHELSRRFNLSNRMTKPTEWHVCPAKTQISLDIRQTFGRMPRLIWIFTGRTCHFVGFVMWWLIWFTCFLCCFTDCVSSLYARSNNYFTVLQHLN